MSESKTSALLCHTLHWVFREAQCWAQFFFFSTSITCIDTQTFCALFILLTMQQFLHPTVTLTVFMPQSETGSNVMWN